MKLLSLTACCLLVCMAVCGQIKQKKQSKLSPGTVTYIVDGDTFDMVDSNRRIIRVRPIGIDADEIKDNKHGKKGPFAQAARNYLIQLIDHKKVRTQTDVRKYDKYGRLLAYVYIDTLFVNATLLKAGMARIETEPPNIRYTDYFYRLQTEARKAKQGMWKLGTKAAKPTKQ